MLRAKNKQGGEKNDNLFVNLSRDKDSNAKNDNHGNERKNPGEIPHPLRT